MDVVENFVKKTADEKEEQQFTAEPSCSVMELKPVKIPLSLGHFLIIDAMLVVQSMKKGAGMKKWPTLRMRL